MPTKTHLMKKIEKEHGATLEEIISELTGKGFSQAKIAQRLGVSYWTLQGWLRDLEAKFETTVRFHRQFSSSESNK